MSAHVNRVAGTCRTCLRLTPGIEADHRGPYHDMARPIVPQRRATDRRPHPLIRVFRVIWWGGLLAFSYFLAGHIGAAIALHRIALP